MNDDAISALTLLGTFILAAILLIAAVLDTRDGVYPSTTTVCYEDMECWDCATMGNLTCGPPPSIGTALVCVEDAGTVVCTES
jgi:hypothetical protein